MMRTWCLYFIIQVLDFLLLGLNAFCLFLIHSLLLILKDMNNIENDMPPVEPDEPIGGSFL